MHLLGDTSVDNSRSLAILNSTTLRAGGFDGLDNVHAIADDLAEDDVAAVQPGGLDSGDEELRTVPAIL